MIDLEEHNCLPVSMAPFTSNTSPSTKMCSAEGHNTPDEMMRVWVGTESTNDENTTQSREKHGRQSRRSPRSNSLTDLLYLL